MLFMNPHGGLCTVGDGSEVAMVEYFHGEYRSRPEDPNEEDDVGGMCVRDGWVSNCPYL